MIRNLDDGLVSIILPSYNCAHFITRAIQSVIDQTYVNWELFVIDNYSTDNTLDVVCNFNDPRIMFLQIHNEGIIAKSRNLGITAAKGRWVAFLDADDWWTSDKLIMSVQALLDGYDFVYHDLIRKGPGKNFFNGRVVRTRQLYSPCFFDLLSKGNGIANSSVVVCRFLLNEIGGLSENSALVAAEDYDCWLRIAQKTEKFLRLSTAYGFYWIGKNNTHNKINVHCYLNEIQNLYFHDYAKYNNCKPLWFFESRAKAFIKKGDYRNAFLEIYQFYIVEKNILLVFKILIIIIFSYCFRNRYYKKL